MSSNTPNHHKIVGLETFWVPLPKFEGCFPTSHTYEVASYERTSASELPARIRDASIIVLTTQALDATALSEAVSPNLRMVGVVASGTDSVDLEACRRRGIHVANTPHCNETSVAEHAIASYFAARRRIPLTHNLARNGDWMLRGSLQPVLRGPDGRMPRTCGREVMGILGYGAVGRKIEGVAKALGMRVLVAGRKGVEAAAAAVPEGRTPFDIVLREASVLVVCLPRSPETLNLISTAELEKMPSHAVLVNVSRGGIVDEEALVKALKAGQIAGAATDVYQQEPASPKTSPLLAVDTAELNLVTTPHVAWVAEDTHYNYNESLRQNIKTWLEGNPTNTVV